MANSRDESDWTAGPPKHAAALALLVASLCFAGLALRDRAAAPERSAARAALAASRVDVNTASRAELRLLPGIGPALAGRIVADRDRRGPFRGVDDLQRVKGIGPRTVARLHSAAVAGPARTP